MTLQSIGQPVHCLVKALSFDGRSLENLEGSVAQQVES